MDRIGEIFGKAKKLVQECGDYLLEVDYDKEESYKSDGSIVTKYDLEIDRKLTEGLNKIVDCPILSEEHKEEINDNYFVIDPIDGTSNFNINMDLFCVMVGYVENGIVQFGIVYIPKLNRMYTAIKGRGAHLNDKKISVRKADLSNRLYCSFNVGKKSIKIAEELLEVNNKFKFRSINSNGISLCFIASSTFDVHYCLSVGGMWDFLAPGVILEEAGGIMKYKRKETGKYMLIAGNKEVVNLLETRVETFKQYL